MERKLMYVELKAGSFENESAWIGYVKMSKSGSTIYFNDHALRKYAGYNSNYIDYETGEEYWVSGVKKSGTNRHPCGHGVIQIDRRAIDEYLALIGKTELPHGFKVIDIEDRFPVERINALLNGRIHQDGESPAKITK